jgi:acyl-CoA reductase-like NAD-dependent aldehyde dehydrogenase
MTTITGTTPHPIYLAGRWVTSPDILEVSDPAHPDAPAGRTYTATPEQYETAVDAAVAAFEETRRLPAYERGRVLREISAGIRPDARSWADHRPQAGKPIRDAQVSRSRGATFLMGAEEASG